MGYWTQKAASEFDPREEGLDTLTQQEAKAIHLEMLKENRNPLLLISKGVPPMETELGGLIQNLSHIAVPYAEANARAADTFPLANSNPAIRTEQFRQINEARRQPDVPCPDLGEREPYGEGNYNSWNDVKKQLASGWEIIDRAKKDPALAPAANLLEEIITDVLEKTRIEQHGHDR